MDRLHADGPSPWREDFGDPVLSDLLRRADKGALDIKTALAKLERAEAEAAAHQANRRPTFILGADAALGGRNLNDTRAAATPFVSGTFETDLFHRLSAAVAAADAEQRASKAEVNEARLLVAAETARAYVSLRVAQLSERYALEARRQADLALALVQVRARNGRADEDDLNRSRQIVAEAVAKIDAARLEARRQQIALETLTGSGAPLALRQLPSPPALGATSSDIIQRRPDVVAAFERLRAADAQRAAESAASRPRFDISLSLGAVDPGVLNLLDARSLVWAAAAALSQDIFDGGRKAARVRVVSSDADIADLAFRKKSLQAWEELRNAIGEANAADADTARAKAAADSTRLALERGRLRHREGAIDGVALADLERETADVSAALSQSVARALKARIALSLAMGG